MKKTSIFLTVLVAIICIFSFYASASVVSEAKPIRLNNETTITLSDIKETDTSYASFTFTPAITDFYEVYIGNLDSVETYVKITDENGGFIADGYEDEFDGTCYAIAELKANRSYYIIVECSVYNETVNRTVTLKKHSHKFGKDYISKADLWNEGSVDNICIKCDFEKSEPIPSPKIKLKNNKFIYNGKNQRPEVIVTDSNKKTFTEGTDYTITYPKSSTNADDYEVNVVMKNNYYDISTSLDYYIDSKKLSASDVKISPSKVSYGEKPVITIKGLKAKKDFYYDLWYWGVGEATVTVYGTGNYTGSVDKTFTVIPAKISGLKASKTTSDSIRLSWKADKNYSTDYYQIFDISKNKIVATVDNDILSYTVKKLKPGKKHSFKVRGYSKENGEKYFGEWKKIEAGTNPDNTVLKSIKNPKSKTLDVEWNKNTKITGYQIQYSTDSNFKSSKTKTITIKNKSQTNKTVSKLKKGKKYYIRIRTYKTLKINNKSTKFYSSWSRVKSIIIK